MHIPHGRWHSNFAWHPGSECRTQPIVISIPFCAMLFICHTPAQRLGFSRTAPFQWCLSPTYSPADAAYRRRHPDPAWLSSSPASLASPSFHGSTQSCCTSPPQITQPHAAHGADSSCRGRQSSSRRYTLCLSLYGLFLRLLSRLLKIRHRFFSNPVRDTQTRLKCHSSLT
jgi:hypothetical protein